MGMKLSPKLTTNANIGYKQHFEVLYYQYITIYS